MNDLKHIYRINEQGTARAWIRQFLVVSLATDFVISVPVAYYQRGRGSQACGFTMLRNLVLKRNGGNPLYIIQHLFAEYQDPRQGW